MGIDDREGQVDREDQVDREGQPYYTRCDASHQTWGEADIVGLTLAVNLTVKWSLTFSEPHGSRLATNPCCQA